MTTTDISGQVNSTAAPIGGYVINTTKLPADLTIDDHVQWIADAFGVEACAIVVAFARELNMKPERALELAKLGDPAFRAACERHVIALRDRAAARRVQAQADQAHNDRLHQRNSITNAIAGMTYMLDAKRDFRANLPRAMRANGAAVSAERLAEMDAEIEQLTKQLEQKQAELDAHDAGPA